MIFKAYADIRQELKRHHAFGSANADAYERFRLSLENLYPKFGIGESEEDEKNFVADFLKETFFKERNAVRVGAKHSIDCQIHVNSDYNSPVGVIIENKFSKAKSGEMVKDGDLLHKAFYETILYYLRLREAKNNSLRRIVITDMETWFVFDALDYNRIFYRSSLLKKYRDYAAGRVSDDSTAAFYAECEEFVKQTNVTLRYACFNFKELAYTKKGEVKKNVTDLYYLLSPYYLLKEDNDDKTVKMNSAFYNELLYIMGLGEVEEKSTKYIRRLPRNKRQAGSLLENVISFIQSHGLTEKLIKFYGDRDEADMVFSAALNLSITWINRLLFLKLLEGQLLYFHKGDNEYKFFKTKGNFSDDNISYADIDDLFFYVLGVPEEKREKFFAAKRYSKIPYLNSSLFEPTEMEKDVMFIGNLNQNFPLPFYKNSVLKSDTQEGSPLNALQYLLHFLDKFDFGSDDKSRQHPDRLISASVLGYIFEKINGYQDGSFYTPQTVTQHMCDQSIEKAVIMRFREYERFARCKTITDIYNTIEDEAEANSIFYSVKICDPAVGSGHFLVAALHKMLALRRDLGLMKDERGRLITKSVNIDIMTDDLLIVNTDDGLPFRYMEGNDELLYVQKTLFNEKKAIIENCLFGVDINPNAVNICRLRLWIELLKSAYYCKPERLQTLPNIDINIKCGDSLIQKYAVQTGKSVLHNIHKESEVWKKVCQYAESVSLYKETADKQVKVQLKTQIEQIKKLIGNNVETSFVETSDSIYFNSIEWMLEFPEVWNENNEFLGFDVVIGNPPYIFNRKLDERKRSIYARKAGRTDSYVYFINLGLAITRKNGILSFITPNTYFTLSSHAKLRDTLLSYGDLDITYTGYCFADAFVETMIFQLVKIEGAEGKVNYFESLESSSSYECDKKIFKNNILSRFFIPTQQNIWFYEHIQARLLPIYEKAKRTLTRDGSIPSDKRRESILNNSKDLMPGTLTFLGLISDGDQGLVTGNNSKYLGVISDDEKKNNEIDSKLIDALNREGNMKITLNEFLADRQRYYDMAEELKTQKNAPSLFGKFFLYKHVPAHEVCKYEQLTDEEQKKGTAQDCWIEYCRGNAEGLRWNVPTTEVINWRSDYVSELKTNSNSRWQGQLYYPTTGFGWVDYFTDWLKGFSVNIGPYSKNVIKMHSFCPLASDKYIIALLNSDFIVSFVKGLITITHTLQINDGRLIPVVIPTKQQHDDICSVVDRIMAGEDEKDCMKELNELVWNVYSPFFEKDEAVDSSRYS
jgi:hypothetical protein